MYYVQFSRISYINFNIKSGNHLWPSVIMKIEQRNFIFEKWWFNFDFFSTQISSFQVFPSTNSPGQTYCNSVKHLCTIHVLYRKIVNINVYVNHMKRDKIFYGDKNALKNNGNQ